MKNIIVPYTAYDLEEAVKIAAGRNDAKEFHKVHSNKFDDNKTERECHEEGIFGELGISLWTGLPIRADLSLSGEKPHGKWDFQFPLTSQTAEVRYRCERDYYDRSSGKRIPTEFGLNSRNMNDFVTDWGILVWPGKEPMTLEIVGCISREMFDELKYPGWLKGPRWMIKTDLLQDLDLVLQQVDPLLVI